MVTEAQLGNGAKWMSYDMFRAAVGEFIGMLLFLFSGEFSCEFFFDGTIETNELVDVFASN